MPLLEALENPEIAFELVKLANGVDDMHDELEAKDKELKIKDNIIEQLNRDIDRYQQQQDEIIVALGYSGISPVEIVAEVELLSDMVKADGEEIGSYRECTGLRGEWKTLTNDLTELEEWADSAEEEISLLRIAVIGARDKFSQDGDYIGAELMQRALKISS